MIIDPTDEIIKQDDLWIILESFFKENNLVRQQLDSFNEFIQNTMQDIIDDIPPIVVKNEMDKLKLSETKKSQKLILRFGQLHLSKPTFIEENGTTHTLLPNEARLRNLTYSSPLYCDVSIICLNIIEESTGEIKENFLKDEHQKILLGRIPIMLRSRFCVLDKLLPIDLVRVGECPLDPGGYFIVNGSEKVIVGQEQLAWNYVYIFSRKETSKSSNKLNFYTEKNLLYFAECRSVAEFGRWSPSLLTVKVCITVFPKRKKTNKTTLANKNSNIHFYGGLYLRAILPLFKKDIPVTWIFKALGFENETEILKHICYDDDEDLIESVKYSLEDDKLTATEIFSNISSIVDQETALAAIGQHVSKGTRSLGIKHAYEILQKEFLPHVGIGQGFELRKGFFFGYILNKLLTAQIGKRNTDDRDHYGHKRLDVAGPLLSVLFRQLLGKVIKDLRVSMQRKFNLGKNTYQISDAIKTNYLTTGIQYALATGNWGTDKQASRTGVSQVLNRLVFSSTLSHLRRLNSPSGKDGNLTKPRQLHNSHWGLICPAETPEGHSCGLVRNLALSAYVTIGSSTLPIMEFLEESKIENLSAINLGQLKLSYKIFVNGCWIGIHANPFDLVKNFRKSRRKGLLREEISISFDIKEKEIRISTDSGRICRPLIVLDNQLSKNTNGTQLKTFFPLLKKKHLEKIKNDPYFYFNYFLKEGIV